NSPGAVLAGRIDQIGGVRPATDDEKIAWSEKASEREIATAERTGVPATALAENAQTGRGLELGGQRLDMTQIGDSNLKSSGTMADGPQGLIVHFSETGVDKGLFGVISALEKGGNSVQFVIDGQTGQIYQLMAADAIAGHAGKGITQLSNLTDGQFSNNNG